MDLVDYYQYEDNQVNDMDAFAREPYVLRFKPHNTGQSTTLEISVSIWFLFDRFRFQAVLLCLSVVSQSCLYIDQFLCFVWAWSGLTLDSKEQEEAGLSSPVSLCAWQPSIWSWQDCIDSSAEGYSADSSPHYTMGLGERAGWAIWCLPVDQE